MVASRSWYFFSISRSLASPSWIAVLRRATSSLRASAFAASFAAMAWPISLEAALRRACASCNF